MESIRVLYVEDDPADRELTRRHLERHAPQVRLSEAGRMDEALDRLAAGNVDLVLADYHLPDGTGVELLAAIKAKTFHVPVVLVTGSPDVEAAARLLKAGAADYVVKRPGYLAALPAVLEGAFRWFQSTSASRGTVVRVLYAEDDPVHAELAQRALKEHGHFNLEVARRGGEALERLRAAPYDLLLLDYHLPDLSGLEVLKALREERIRVPVVIVTDHGEEETVVQAFKLGAAEYLLKGQGYLASLPATLENVLAQRRLANEKEKFQKLLEAAPDAMVVINKDGRIVLANSQAKRSFGYTAEEMLGQPVEILVPERFHGYFAELRGRPAGAGLDLYALRKDGHEFPVEISLNPLETEEGSLVISVIRDITERRRAEEMLRQTEKLAAMGQLLAGVAHELSNPLSVIIGHTALLAKTVGEGPPADRAEKIARAAERCARIVRNFLAMARQQPPERRRVALNDVVREAVELLAYPLRVDNVKVDLDLSPDLPFLWADSNQLHQVVVNLVINAHHAMRETPLPRQLTLTSRSHPGQGRVVLEVADTGPGIPHEIQARIFEPFFTTKPLGQGTGLGLSLCLGIIEVHGGSIRVESPPAQGAVFRVELPVEAPPVPAPEVPPPDALPPLQGKAILVVDDEPEVADVLADILSADGHQVETAANGIVALDKLGERAYDLIMSDIKMPELDGPSLHRELERRHPHLLRRCIFLTGDTLNPETRRFLEYTGAPSLGKPFSLEEVRRVIRLVLPAQGDGSAGAGAP